MMAQAPFYLITGNDEGAVKERALSLVEELLPDWGGEMGLETIDCNAESVEQAVQKVNAALSAIQSMPMFSTRKLVWLKNLNLLSDTVLGRSESVQAALSHLLALFKEGLPDFCGLILSVIEPDKRRSAYKELSKLTKPEVLDRIDTGRSGWEQGAIARLRDGLSTAGITADEATLLLFVQRTGADTRAMDSEMAKVDLYLGERRTLTPEDVRLLVPLTKSAIIFELGHAISECSLRHALELLDILFAQKETAIGILLASIVPTVRQLLLARDLIERHHLDFPSHPSAFMKALERLPQKALDHLPRKKDGSLSLYPLAIAATYAKNHSLASLLNALAACVAANVSLVSSQTDPRVTLARLIVQIISPPTSQRVA